MAEPSEKIRWHEVRVFGTNGTVYPLKIEHIISIMLSRQFILCIVTYATVLAIVQSEIYLVQVSLHFRLIYTVANSFLALLIWSIILCLIAGFLAMINCRVPIPMIMLHLATVSIQIPLNQFVMGNLLGPPFRPDASAMPGEILEYTVVLTVFELLVVVFLLPRLNWVSRLLADVEAPGSPEPVILTAAARHFPVDQIHYLKSVEHYVEIVTHDGAELVRATLRDLIEQLSDYDGIQPHRSYWVPYKAVVLPERENGNVVLRLINGAT